MRRAVIGIFTALVVGILFVVLCTFVRRPYEKILLDRFGKLIPEDQQVRIAYNWYFKLPTDSVVPIDTRLHLYTGPLQQVVTRGSEPIAIRAFAAWRIVDPVKFYRTTGGSDQRAKDIMDQKLRGLIQGKLASHSLDELFNIDEKKVHTAVLENEVAQDATGSAEELKKSGKANGLLDQGLEIVEVGFSRMAFPPANAGPVYMRMVAELNQRARDYESQGIAAVSTIRAQGDAEAGKIRAEAVSRAEQIRGEGDGEANRLIASVQQTPAARDFYQYWKGLDFVKSSLAKNTILVLSSDSDWLKSLFKTPVNGGEMTAPGTQPSSAGTGQVLPENPTVVPLNRR